MTKPVPMLHYHTKTKHIRDIAWSPDGEHLAIISHNDHSLEIIHSRSAHEIYHGVYGTGIHAVAWSPDNTSIARGSGDAPGETESTLLSSRKHEVLVLDVHKHRIVRTLATPEAVSALAWSPLNRYISIAARDTIIWDVEQQQEISRIRAKDGLAASYVAWLQDSRYLLIAWSARRYEIERTLTIHEATTGKHISSIEVDTSPKDSLRSAMSVRSLAVAPTGTSIAVAGVCRAVEDDPEAPVLGIVCLIDLATGQERQIGAGIFGRIRRGPFTEAICWSHDGRYIATSGWLHNSDTCSIVDVTGNDRGIDVTVEGEPVGQRNSPAIKALAWSPIDYRLAVATSDACLIYHVQE